MNFYKAQDQARRQTKILVFLFVLAVLCLLILTNACFAAAVWFSDISNLAAAPRPDISTMPLGQKFWTVIQHFGWQKGLSVTAIVLSVIGVATWSKWSDLSKGGFVVAQSLGGCEVLASSSDRYERRALNIVQEMAIASGVPAPKLYVLENEQGLNAFAAGNNVHDAVIGVTDGAMRTFSRDQLQGVVAHEFSHILNGDMKLNTRIVAVLHGLLMINEAGRLFIDLAWAGRRRRSLSNRENNGAGVFFLALGLALMVLGFLGQFFGAIIKAAVSRQREFLADASAVQFTRNPNGIGDALRVLANAALRSKVRSPKAHEVGHLFFSAAYRAHIFSTHPSLDERIRRILPKWRGGTLPDTPESQQFEGAAGLADGNEQISGFAAGQSSEQKGGVSLAGGESETVAGAEVLQPIEFVSPFENAGSLAAISADVPSAVGDPDRASHSGPASIELLDQAPSESTLDKAKSLATEQQDLLDLVSEPYGIHLYILSYLAVQGLGVGKHELRVVHARFLTQLEQNAYSPSFVDEAAVYIEKINRQSVEGQLRCLELGMPNLKALSTPQYKKLRAAAESLVKHDGKHTLQEWAAIELMKCHCDSYFGLAKAERLKYRSVKSVHGIYEDLLTRVFLISENGRGSDRVERALALASEASGIKGLKLRTPNELKAKGSSWSTRELARAYPLVKPRLLKGLIAMVQEDGVISDKERLFVTVIAAIWDSPLIGLELEQQAR